MPKMKTHICVVNSGIIVLDIRCKIQDKDISMILLIFEPVS